MKLGQLIDRISFESGVVGRDTISGHIELVIKETLDSLTALQRYDDLLVPDYVLDLSGSTVTLPSDVQHLDFKRIRYRPAGDSTADRFLNRGKTTSDNTGQPRFFRKVSSTLVLFPDAEISATDDLVIDYWQFATAWPDDLESDIIPDLLVSTLLNECVARVSANLGDIKRASAARGFAKDAFVRHLGAKDIAPQNGP